jgi:cytochrome b561
MADPNAYSRLQIGLHWTIALLVVLQLSINAGVRDAFGDRLEGLGPGLAGLAAGTIFHIVSGMTILALTLLRLVVRLRRGAPEAEEGVPPVIALMAVFAHAALYGFLLFMPVTGLIAWFFASEFFGTLHEIGRFLLVPLIAAHALAALVEHFVLRNDTLRRMLRYTAR